MGWALSIDRANVADVKLAEDPGRPLEPGEARLAVKRFALTANNITYAVFGESMGYWNFFPGADGRGRLPVWGFAEVAEPGDTGLEAGERIYGYFPAAAELIVRPARVSAEAFFDAAPHRAGLPSAYNRYVRCAADPAWSAEREPVQMVHQPLFITAFLIDLHLREEEAFGAGRISLTSASSKTALALAYLLSRDRGHKAQIEALTSPRNRDFVAGTGFYDEIATYDEIRGFAAEPARLIVDFAGDAGVNTALHETLAETLKANIRVGGAHWEQSAPARGLPGPKPVFFFAPDHVKRRSAEWGGATFAARYGAAWTDYADTAATMFESRELTGAEAALEIYRAFIEGSASASEALTVSV
ncbi:MAG: DUF2855 family protein [Oceanicaulis sp.]